MNRLLAILLLLFTGSALAQSPPVFQSGVVTPGHGVKWITTGVVGDSGGQSVAVYGSSKAGQLAYWFSPGSLAGYNATAGLPFIGSATNGGVTQGSVSGNTTVFGTTSGFLTPGDCLRSDSSGNIVDAGVQGCTGGVIATPNYQNFTSPGTVSSVTLTATPLPTAINQIDYVTIDGIGQPLGSFSYNTGTHVLSFPSVTYTTNIFVHWYVPQTLAGVGSITANGTSLYGAIILAAGNGIGLSVSGQTITIASPAAFNVQTYGASGSAQSTTGTISSSDTTLTLAAAKDFVNGQGIRINHAGTAFTLNQPTSISVSAEGATGSTHYSYEISSLDCNGGIGAATSAVTITNGNATLTNSVSQFGTFNGNYNLISWTAPSPTPCGYAIFRQVGGSGSYSFALTVGSENTSVYDLGTYFLTPPDYIPSTAPASSLADALVTTISSGGGSTALVLANSASTTATVQGVYHDDTVAVQDCLNALVAYTSCYFPPGHYGVKTLGLAAPGNISYFGNGESSCIAPWQDGIHWATSGSSQSFYNLCLDGTNLVGTTTTNGLLDTTNTAQITIKDIYMIGIPSGSSGLYVGGNQGFATGDNVISGIRIYDFTSNGPGLAGVRLSALTADSSITRLIVGGAFNVAYALEMDSGAQTWTITNSHPYNAYINVANITGTKWSTFSDVTFDNSYDLGGGTSNGNVVMDNSNSNHFSNVMLESIQSGNTALSLIGTSSYNQFTNLSFTNSVGSNTDIYEASGANSNSFINNQWDVPSNFSLPPTVAFFSGIGNSGTATLATGSTTEKGEIILTPGGSGITYTGVVTLEFPRKCQLQFGSQGSGYSWTLVPGSADWSGGGTAIQTSTGLPAGEVQVSWNNGANNILNNSHTWGIWYNCNG